MAKIEKGKYYLYLDNGSTDIDESNCIELDCIAEEDGTNNPSIFAIAFDNKDNTLSEVLTRIGNFINYVFKNLKI